MTASGRPAGGTAAGGAVSRGLVLIGIAVLLGLFLLWQGLDDGSGAASGSGGVDGGSADGGDSSSDGSDGTDGSDETDGADSADGGDQASTSTEDLFPTTNTRVPGEVKVLVANGSGIGGAAGLVNDSLKPFGYSTLDPANADDTEVSRIFYRSGFHDDAEVIRTRLSAAVDTLEAFPTDGVLAVPEATFERVETANVVVIIGSDNLVPVPSAG